MKKLIAIVMAVVLLATLLPGVALAAKPAEGFKGNGLPKDMGKSYNFNVIGVNEESHWGWDDDSGGSGKRIFITREGNTKFYVGAGTSFSIEDRNGLDGLVGESTITDGHLANPGLILPYDFSGNKWNCTVYVRLLGPTDAEFKWRSEYYDGSQWLELADWFLVERGTKFAVPGGQILADGWQDILWEWDYKKNYRICQFRIFVGAPSGGY